jgi:hypothetical protein
MPLISYTFERQEAGGTKVVINDGVAVAYEVAVGSVVSNTVPLEDELPKVVQLVVGNTVAYAVTVVREPKLFVMTVG